jgi:hypothetical protein
VVEHLISKHEALSLNPSTVKKKEENIQMSKIREDKKAKTTETS